MNVLENIRNIQQPVDLVSSINELKVAIKDYNKKFTNEQQVHIKSIMQALYRHNNQETDLNKLLKTLSTIYHSCLIPEHFFNYLNDNSLLYLINNVYTDYLISIKNYIAVKKYLKQTKLKVYEVFLYDLYCKYGNEKFTYTEMIKSVYELFHGLNTYSSDSNARGWYSTTIFDFYIFKKHFFKSNYMLDENAFTVLTNKNFI